MFPPYVWQFTARAVEPTTALFFYAAILREYCEKDHSLGRESLVSYRLFLVRIDNVATGHRHAERTQSMQDADGAGMRGQDIR